MRWHVASMGTGAAVHLFHISDLPEGLKLEAKVFIDDASFTAL